MWTGVGKLVLLHLLLMELGGHAKGKPLIGSEMGGISIVAVALLRLQEGGSLGDGMGKRVPLPSAKRLACLSGPSHY